MSVLVIAANIKQMGVHGAGSASVQPFFMVPLDNGKRIIAAAYPNESFTKLHVKTKAWLKNIPGFAAQTWIDTDTTLLDAVPNDLSPALVETDVFPSLAAPVAILPAGSDTVTVAGFNPTTGFFDGSAAKYASIASPNWSNVVGGTVTTGDVVSTSGGSVVTRSATTLVQQITDFVKTNPITSVAIGFALWKFVLEPMFSGKKKKKGFFASLGL